MSIAYVKQVREQVAHAIEEAKGQGVRYTPVFWTGNHLNPVLIGLILKEK